jgi:dynein heavy chain
MEEFNYNTPPQRIVKEILGLIEKALEELRNIPDLEPKILESLHKAKKNETYVLTPYLPNNEPEIPPENPQKFSAKRYPEENKWVWDLYHKFKDLLTVAVTPLKEFTKQFDKYLSLLKIKPEAYVNAIENDDEFQSADRIKQEIEKFNRLEKDLREAIPEEIHVSCFQINCKELISFLSGKYQDLSKRLIDLIARKARESTVSIFQQLADIQKEINKNSANIEELTELNEYIENDLPNLLEKIKLETQSCIDIYGILEEYNFKIAKEDLNKKWEIFGGPKKIFELIENRDAEMKKMSDDF